MNLNKLWMELIKKEDYSITFIGLLISKGEEFVQVILKNDLKGKDTITFKCLNGFSNMRSNEWEYIRTTLKNKTYLKKDESETTL